MFTTGHSAGLLGTDDKRFRLRLHISKRGLPEGKHKQAFLNCHFQRTALRERKGAFIVGRETARLCQGGEGTAVPVTVADRPLVRSVVRL